MADLLKSLIHQIETIETATLQLITLQDRLIDLIDSSVQQSTQAAALQIRQQLAETKTLLASASAQQSVNSEITVGRINIVEPDRKSVV